jgi:hypothetical protein
MPTKDIHLCGSIPLANAAEVFAMVSDKLGSGCQRIPDGETGERLSWIRWQDHVFNDHPQLDAVDSEGDFRNATAVINAAGGTQNIAHTTWWKIKGGIAPEELEMGPLGYASAAIESYAEFQKQKAAGGIGADARFLVAVPSPFNVINSCIAPEDRIRVEPAYEARMRQELDEIAAAIPHDQLAIQWDNAHDMQAFEGARQSYFPFHQDGIAARLIAFGDCLPAGIEFGYHFCYGSFGGKHFVEPVSMAPMVDLANRQAAGVGRAIEFLHMPVPVERDDDAYFEALKDLQLKPGTKLYLGLVHDTDGLAGARRRMATADKYVGDYGIATECGFGRRPADTVPGLLEIHAAIAE